MDSLQRHGAFAFALLACASACSTTASQSAEQAPAQAAPQAPAENGDEGAAADEQPAFGESASAYATCPPEATTRDSSGTPRNAAGQVRYCWPGETNCYCDRDGDCYDQEGYVACTATRTTTTTSSTQTTTTQTGTRVTSVSYAANPTSGVVGRATTITATSTGSSAPRYRFWVVTPAGAWTQPCGGYTANTTCTFTPNAAGTWKIAVSARHATSTANYDATTNERAYTVSATAPATQTQTQTTTTQTGTRVTSVSYAANPTSGVVGRATTITATSTGSSAPRYRFWVVTPTGTWTRPCGDYISSNTCTFTPNAAGTWKIAVSARHATSTANYDATTNERDYVVTATATTTTQTQPQTQPQTTTNTDTTSSNTNTGPMATNLRAFPSAEGFGANASGGRGGRVIYVTNLNSSGPGSLNDALAQTGPRYILFKVSGVINAPAELLQGNVTIAGQTSPGGITVRGFDTTEEPYCEGSCGGRVPARDNIIVRHLRSRPAGENGPFPDGVRLRYVRNVVLDHVSIGNAVDEAMEISYSNNITVQNTLIAETVGDHAHLGGVLINYSDPTTGYALDRITLHHNNWNRMGGRMPELSRETSQSANTTMQIEVTNNLMWDPGYYLDANGSTLSGGMSGSPIYYAMNWVGNYYFARPDYPYGMFSMATGSNTQTRVFAQGNQMNLYPTRSDWDFAYCCNDYATEPVPARPAYAINARHAFPAVTTQAATSLPQYMVANVGAFPRDPMDRRLMGAVARGVIDSAARDVNPANDALLTNPAAAAPTDTDSDGMPDAWETAHGLNPSVQDHNGTSLSTSMMGGVAGYTNLECYLEELSRNRVAGR